jgi:hypothetical protein
MFVPIFHFLMKPIKLLLFTVILFHSCALFAQTDQNKYVCKKLEKEHWRELSEQGKFKEAISELFDTLQHQKQVHKHAVYWHIGQLYAFDNDYDNAIRYLKKSAHIFDKLADREWRLYFKGTIAFLQKDKEKLKKFCDKLWNKHTGYNEKNALMLKALYENYDKTYREIFRKF